MKTQLDANLKSSDKLEIKDDREYNMDKDKALLIEYLKENLAHVRHVENERLTFNALFIAIVGGAIGLISSINSCILKLCVTGILILINIISLCLTERWSNVFDGHMQVAKNLHKLIMGKEDLSEEELNKYYYFKNTKRRKRYLTTRKFFKCLNCILLALLIGMFLAISKLLL